MSRSLPSVLVTLVLAAALAVGLAAPGGHLPATALVAAALAHRLVTALVSALVTARLARRTLPPTPDLDVLTEARAV